MEKILLLPGEKRHPTSSPARMPVPKICLFSRSSLFINYRARSEAPGHFRPAAALGPAAFPFQAPGPFRPFSTIGSRTFPTIVGRPSAPAPETVPSPNLSLHESVRSQFPVLSDPALSIPARLSNLPVPLAAGLSWRAVGTKVGLFDGPCKPFPEIFINKRHTFRSGTTAKNLSTRRLPTPSGPTRS